MQLSKKDLIQCRLVSIIWNKASSNICRRQLVRLNIIKLKEKGLDELRRTFRSRAELTPWSSFTVTVMKEWTCWEFVRNHYVSSELIVALVEEFGAQIRHLHAIGDGACSVILDLLRNCPYLEQVNIKFSGNRKVPILGFGEDLKLSRLKYLKFQFYSLDDLAHFEVIMKSCGSRLKHVCIDYHPSPANHSEKIVSLIHDIPSISFTFCYQFIYFYTLKILPILIEQKVFLTKLCVILSSTQVSPEPIASVLRSYRQLLLFNSMHLRKLKFSMVRPRTTESYDKFKIPTLHALKILKIFERFIEDEPFSMFAPLDSNQFPVLERVLLQNRNIWNSNPQFHNSQFKSVKKLDIHDFIIDNAPPTDWNVVFPNLKTLNCKADEQVLHYVLTTMNQLEHLGLLMQNKGKHARSSNTDPFYFEGDLNVLLTGITNYEEVYLERTQAIIDTRARYGLPSILSLTGKP